MIFYYNILIACAFTALFTPIIRLVAIKLNIQDHPNTRKIHKEPTPLLGGVAVYLGVIIPLSISNSVSPEIHGILIGTTILFLSGLIDDIKETPATLRFVLQIVASIIVIKFGVRISFLPNNIYGITGEWFLTIIWLLGITNAVNFFDGMDGLASGLVAIMCTFFFVIAMMTGQKHLATLSSLIIGASIGFLFYNFHPAKIFLGDAGSQFLGFATASLAVLGEWSEKGPLIAFGIPCLITGILIFDMFYITVKRIAKGETRSLREYLEYVGKDHFHHRVANLGFSHRQTVIFAYLVTIILGISALILRRTFNMLNAILLIAQAGIIFLIISMLMHIKTKSPTITETQPHARKND